MKVTSLGESEKFSEGTVNKISRMNYGRAKKKQLRDNFETDEITV